jgi:hypothetical protein
MKPSRSVPFTLGKRKVEATTNLWVKNFKNFFLLKVCFEEQYMLGTWKVGLNINLSNKEGSLFYLFVCHVEISQTMLPPITHLVS